MNEMEQKRIQRIIEQVATKEGLSVEVVRKEMKIAINEAFNNRREPGNEDFINLFGDRCPTIEEFIFVTTALVSFQTSEREANEGRSQ